MSNIYSFQNQPVLFNNTITNSISTGTNLSLTNASTTSQTHISSLQPSLNTSQTTQILLGRANTLNNSAFINFSYLALGSATNKLTLGLNSQTGLTIDGNNNLIVPGTITSSITTGTNLTLTNTASSSQIPLTIFQSSLTVSGTTQIQLGISNTTNLGGNIIFTNVSSGNPELNTISLGLVGGTGVLSINGSGTTIAGNTTSFASGPLNVTNSSTAPQAMITAFAGSLSEGQVNTIALGRSATNFLSGNLVFACNSITPMATSNTISLALYGAAGFSVDGEGNTATAGTSHTFGPSNSTGTNTVLVIRNNASTQLIIAHVGVVGNYSTTAFVGDSVFRVDGASSNMIFQNGSGESALRITSANNVEVRNNLSIISTTASTSTTTGALVVSGGIGIAKKLFVGDGIQLTNSINDITTVTRINSSGNMVNSLTAGNNVLTSMKVMNKRIRTSYANANNSVKTWTTRTSAADNEWYSVCWSAELSIFVAVSGTGVGNRVMTSPDGITWTIRTSAADNLWYSVCWSAELSIFVAVSGTGVGNRVMTSPDGINWTSRTSAADNLWGSVCWSAELSIFVAVAFTGGVMTSPDGITWTSRTSAADNIWSSVCWSAELSIFVAVSANGVMTSPDGITWTSRTSAADNFWYSVCWSAELSIFVAVASTGTGNRVMTSSNGIDWATRTSAADNEWSRVCWSAELSIFVAVSRNGVGNRVMTSPDGITWTSRTSAADNSWSSVCWSAELSIFVAVAFTGGGNRVMTSNIGIPASKSALLVNPSYMSVNNSNGNVSITSTTASTSTTTGALVVGGGIGIAGDINVGENLTAQGYNHIFGPSSSTNQNTAITIQNNASSRVELAHVGAIGNYSTSAVVGDFVLRSVSGNLIFQVSSGTGAIKINASNNVEILPTTASTSSTTGALVVSGGVGIAGSINVGGNIRLGPTTDTNADYYIRSSGQLNISANDNPVDDSFTFLNLTTGVGGNLSSINMVGSGASKYIAFSTTAVERMRIESSGIVGINTTVPVSRLTINSIVVDRSAFDHSVAPLTITQPTPTSNTLLNDQLPVLHLTRQGTAGQTFGARATFALSRYENDATNSRTRLDIQLSQDSYDNLNTFTIRGNGSANLTGTAPTLTIGTTGLGAGAVYFGNSSHGILRDGNNVATYTTSGSVVFRANGLGGGDQMAIGAGSVNINTLLRFPNNSPIYLTNDNNHGIGYSGGGDGPDVFGFSGGRLMQQGNVRLQWNSAGTNVPFRFGVGETNPTFPIHVSRSDNYTRDPNFFIDGPGIIDPGSMNGNFSAYFNDNVVVKELWGVSDARIKTGITDINDTESLDILRRLQPRKFSFIDGSESELKINYGFIAQEVEGVLPDSVTYTKRKLPTIMETCTVNILNDADNVFIGTEISTVTKSIPENWDSGLKIEIVDKTGTKSLVTIKSIESSKSFIVHENLPDPRYYVYGEEVDDFRILHKDVIYSVTTAAVQEIDRCLRDTQTKVIIQENLIVSQNDKIINLETQISLLQNQINLILDSLK